jgi:predicted trehalose synthase
VKKFIEEMAKVIAKKSDLISKARAVYLEVIEFRSANWAIAALTRIGEMFQQLANDIYDAPAPGSFDEEQVETYKGSMAERAQPVEGKAVEAYVTAVKKAQELRWFNEYSDKAAKELARLSPKEYRYDGEVRSKPEFFGSPTFRQPYISTLPAQEEQ